MSGAAGAGGASAGAGGPGAAGGSGGVWAGAGAADGKSDHAARTSRSARRRGSPLRAAAAGRRMAAGRVSATPPVAPSSPARARAWRAAPRRGLVDASRRGIDHHAVVVARRLQADQLVAHVAQDAGGIALQRIAPAAGARLLVAEDVAAPHGHRDLGGDVALLAAPVVSTLRDGRPGAPP